MTKEIEDRAEKWQYELQTLLDETKEDMGKVLWRMAESAKEAGRGFERQRVLSLFDTFFGELKQRIDAHEEFGDTPDKMRGLIYQLAGMFREVVADEEYQYDFKGAEANIEEMAKEALGMNEKKFVPKTSVKLDNVSAMNEREETELVLWRHIVVLMSQSGTHKDGPRAEWTADQVVVGLKNSDCEVSDEIIAEALKNMKLEGLAHVRHRGAQRLYALDDDALERFDVHLRADDYPDKEGYVEEAIEELIQSNQDSEGNLLPWTFNQVRFAFRDKLLDVGNRYGCYGLVADEAELEATLKKHPHIVRDDDGKYQWVESPPKEEERSESPIVKGKAPKDMRRKVLDVMRNDSLRNDSGDGTRAWRDYDVVDAMRREEGYKKDKGVFLSGIRVALNDLVDEGLARHDDPAPHNQWVERWVLLRKGFETDAYSPDK